MRYLVPMLAILATACSSPSPADKAPPAPENAAAENAAAETAAPANTAPATPPAEAGDAGKKIIGMPNPASAYCVEQGGTLEIRKGDGGDTGWCHLPDGRVIEEWEFFRASRAAAPK